MIVKGFQYVLKKAFEIAASLGVLAALSFLLLKALPGGPFDEETALNPLVKEKLSEHWNIQDSVFSQALSYISSVFQGDLGVSMVRPDRPVVDIISQGLSSTLMLNLISLVLIIVLALGTAIVAAAYRKTWFSGFLNQMVIACLSLPSLFWGPVLIYIFAVHLNLLPVALLSSPLHYVLPILTLSMRPWASLVRLLKNSMIDNMALDYVRTATSKGLSQTRILAVHVLKNSLIPFLSYLGPLTASLISGSFLVEMLFAIPGLGTEFIMALNDRDYTLIVGLTLFYGVLLIVLNGLIDVLMRFADPRLREEM